MIDYLLDGLIGGTALALVALLACRLAAVRSRPSLVFAIWLVVIARFAVPGLVPVEVPAETIAVLDAPADAAAMIDAEPASAGGEIAWRVWAARAWIAGVAALGLLALIGWVRLHRRIAALPPAPLAVRRRAAAIAARLGLRRAVQVRVDPRRGPFAAGVLRPVVVLPGWLAGAGPELDHVLAHELAHHKRLDPMTAAAVRLAGIAFFFWPVMWLAGRRLAAARERATDSLAVGRAGDRRGYARALVRVTLAARTGQPLGAAAMAAAPSQLRGRIAGVLGGARAGIGRAGALGLAGLIALALPAARVAAAEPAPEAVDCQITPGVGERILATHPDADRDGDGILSRDEICAHQRRMQQRLAEAAVRADVLVDSEHYWFSSTTIAGVASIAAVDVEIADAGGAVCTPAANRCVDEMVLIDVSAE